MNVSKKGVRERFGLPGTEISYQSKRVQGSSCLALIVAMLKVVALTLSGIHPRS
jgi:hypothetical protein